MITTPYGSQPKAVISAARIAMMSVCIAVNSGEAGTAPVLLNAFAIWLTLLPSLPSSPNSRASSTRSTLGRFMVRAPALPKCHAAQIAADLQAPRRRLGVQFPPLLIRHPHGNAA